MNRAEILEVINNLIVEEHGEKITEEDSIVDSGVDSFGIIVVFTSLENMYPNFVFGTEKEMNLKYIYAPIKEIIDIILEEK